MNMEDAGRSGGGAVTLSGVKVWNTGEIIDVVLPGIDADRLIDDTGAVRDGVAGGRDVRVDASGLTLAPGFEDPHVHFRDPGQRDKETMATGCAAAASGGYTHVLIMPNTVPAMDGRDVAEGEPGADEVLGSGCRNVIDYLQHYDDVHGTRLPVRYSLCASASVGRAGREATTPKDWARYMPGGPAGAADPEAAAHPVIALSDDGAAFTDATIDDVFEAAKETGILLIDHCEHHDTGVINEGPVSRELGLPGVPESTELAVVSRDIDKARATGVHVHLQHMSTASGIAAVREAKRQGLPVTCETAPHYLALCDRDVLGMGALAKMNPPLRSAEDRRAVIEAVADGTVDLLATDHAPHTAAEKGAGLEKAPNGIIGLEAAYAVCHTVLVDGGWIDDARLIELMSVEPARLMGRTVTDVDGMLDGAAAGDAGRRVLDLRVSERAGRADMVLLDTVGHWTVDPGEFHSKARNTPYGGWDVTGRPLATIIGSRVVFSRIPAERVSAGRQDAAGKE